MIILRPGQNFHFGLIISGYMCMVLISFLNRLPASPYTRCHIDRYEFPFRIFFPLTTPLIAALSPVTPSRQPSRPHGRINLIDLILITIFSSLCLQVSTQVFRIVIHVSTHNTRWKIRGNHFKVAERTRNLTNSHGKRFFRKQMINDCVIFHSPPRLPARLHFLLRKIGIYCLPLACVGCRSPPFSTSTRRNPPEKMNFTH